MIQSQKSSYSFLGIPSDEDDPSSKQSPSKQKITRKEFKDYFRSLRFDFLDAMNSDSLCDDLIKTDEEYHAESTNTPPFMQMMFGVSNSSTTSPGNNNNSKADSTTTPPTKATTSQTENTSVMTGKIDTVVETPEEDGMTQGTGGERSSAGGGAAAGGGNSASSSNTASAVSALAGSIPLTTFSQLATSVKLFKRPLDALAHKRVAYHRLIESIRDQAVFVCLTVAELLEELGRQAAAPLFKIGVIVSDVLPDTGELYFKLLVDGLLNARSRVKISQEQITFFGRREDVKTWTSSKWSGIQVVENWEGDTQRLSDYPILVVLCSSMHVTLVEEQLRGHNISKSIILPFAGTGVTHNKWRSLLKSDMIVFPCLDFSPQHGDIKIGVQNLVWEHGRIRHGMYLPDLDQFKSTLSQLCVAIEVPADQIQRLVSSVMPDDVVAGVESQQQLVDGSRDQFLASFL